MRATHARILVCLALAKSHVSISQEGNQQVQIMMHAVIDGSGVWLDNKLQCVSTEYQQFLVL